MLVATLSLAQTFSTSAAMAQSEETLVVFAASSLTNAFLELGEAYESEHPDTEIVFQFAGSSTLALQLAEGAPADVFASADENQMAAVQEAGRITGAVEPFVLNRLALAVPVDNPANIETLEDLRSDNILLVLAEHPVPVREYTDVLLARLSTDDAFGEDFGASVEDNIVSEESNVRQIVAKIVLGEADVGIVYQSDITPDIADDVVAIPIESDLSPLVVYPIAITDDSENPELARDFVDFVLSEAGQAILVQWGFVSIQELETQDTATINCDTASSACLDDKDDTDS